MEMIEQKVTRSGCRIALYCSRACQSKAWNSGHSEYFPKIEEGIGYNLNSKQELGYLLHRLQCTEGFIRVCQDNIVR